MQLSGANASALACGPAPAAACRSASRSVGRKSFAGRLAGVLCLWVISAGLLFLGNAGTRAVANTSPARLWDRVIPAAGVRIQSAASFRALAISSSGSPLVDIYQLNTDGTSTKLDTIVASTTGTYGAGPYTTHNMAAIYWQFASAPAASAGPPPASVTFINDAPAIPLSGLYFNPLPQTPFAATDPSLLLNLDLRKGAPVGWGNYGSGVFDATNGYLPGTGSTNGIANTAV